MNGMERVGYGDIADWARLLQIDVDPIEVAALAHLTDVMAFPPDAEESDDG